MIVQEETRPPATTPTEPEPEKKPARPTKEEEIEWFKKQAQTDLTARQLFKKRN